MDNKRELLWLIHEHPDLPIVPMVDSDVCANEDYGRWMGELGMCRVGRYAIIDGWYGDGRVLFEGDEAELIESIAEGKYKGTDEDYKKAEQEAREKWHDAIIVNIDPV